MEKAKMFGVILNKQIVPRFQRRKSKLRGIESLPVSIHAKQ